VHSIGIPESGNLSPGCPVDPSTSLRTGLRAMVVAFFVGVVVMAMKFAAYWLTDSSAILSDALESIINVVASAFALGSLWVSAKPPDRDHPYGHGKIEFFSAGFEGALIILAAIGIFVEGLQQILEPRGLPHLRLGLLVLVAAGVTNLVLGIALVRIGRRTDSLILVADGKHVLTDVYTSGGVLAGLVLVQLTGWYMLDGVVACIVGVHIIVSGCKLVRQAFGGLMDASDPVLLEEICSLLAGHRKDLWIDVHRLRAKRAGKRVQIDFHLILPRDIPLEDAHAEVKELERIFAEHLRSQSDVLIHLDPCTDPDCPICVNDPCRMRRQGTVSQRTWKQEALTCETESAHYATNDTTTTN
jgi:cation diffusion facilitator family transporter